MFKLQVEKENLLINVISFLSVENKCQMRWSLKLKYWTDTVCCCATWYFKYLTFLGIKLNLFEQNLLNCCLVRNDPANFKDSELSCFTLVYAELYKFRNKKEIL